MQTPQSSQQVIQIVADFFRAAIVMRNTLAQSTAELNKSTTLQGLINLANSKFAPDSITEEFKRQSSLFLALDLNGIEGSEFRLAKMTLIESIFPALDLASYDWNQLNLKGSNFISTTSAVIENVENLIQATKTITDAYYSVNKKIGCHLIPCTAFLLNDLSVK